MKNIAEKLEQIAIEIDTDQVTFEQLLAYEKTIQELEKLTPMTKPTYIFPQVDTLGKQTYGSLNKI